MQEAATLRTGATEPKTERVDTAIHKGLEFLAEHLFFWHKGEAAKNDVDTVVNANILYYLGRDWFTRPVIGHLLDVIRENSEGNCDKWYHNPLIIYYAIARNYAKGIRELEPAAHAITERVLGQVGSGGRIGPLPVDTAVALTTLLRLGYAGPEIPAAAQYLLSCQDVNGSWPRRAMAWAGPYTPVGWGSEQLSTALCLEAVELYRRMKKENAPEKLHHEMA